MATHEDICDALLGYPLSRVVVLDTETTGLTIGNDEILSVAFVDGHGNALFSSYVKPTRHKFWPEAQMINHISPYTVADAPTIEQLYPQITGFFSRDVLIVGYNVSFDLGFLFNADVFAWSDMKETFDVMREYARVHGEQRWGSGGYRYSKLAECAQHYGYSFDAHDALEDARATSYCFRALLCDQAYHQLRIAERRAELSKLTTTQTKATKSNIAEALGLLVSADAHGSLVIGEVTRGKNKGRKRLECELNGKCVGIVTKTATEKVLALLHARDLGDLGESIAVKLALKSSNSSYACTFAIEPIELIDEVKELSERDDPTKDTRRMEEQLSGPTSAEAVLKDMSSATVVPRSANGTPRPKNTSNGGSSITNALIVASAGCFFLVLLVPGGGFVAALLFAIIAYFVFEARK